MCLILDYEEDDKEEKEQEKKEEEKEQGKKEEEKEQEKQEEEKKKEGSGFILVRKRRFQREMGNRRQEPVSVEIQISDVEGIFQQVTQRTQRRQQQEILLAVNYTQ